MKPAIKTATYKADPMGKVVEVCMYIAVASLFLLSGLNPDTVHNLMLAVR